MEISVKERVLLGLILLLGSFLRLYQLPETLMFRGDQGRDAIIVKRILKDRDIALIGPVTSVGNMYLGPFYYYFMLPFLALSYPSPLGPAYGVALVNITTIALLYFVAKSLFDKRVAFLSVFFFSIMPVAVQYSRFSWNPNIAPFFAVLLLWNLDRWWQSRSWKDVALIFLWVGILAQLHYVTLVSFGIVGGIFLFSAFRRSEIGKTLLQLVGGGLIFVVTQLPLVIFDFRHNHLIFNSFLSFSESPEKHLNGVNIVTQLKVFGERGYLVLAELFSVPYIPGLVLWIVLTTLLITLTLLWLLHRSRRLTRGPIFLTWWLFVSIVGISFYSHTVFPHYLTFCYPIIALFWSWIIVSLWNYRFARGIAGAIALVITIHSGLGIRSFSWTGLGTTIAERTVQETIAYVKPPYNIALLSDDHDYKGMIYRYFFEATTTPPQEPDDYDNLQSLVVIDEVQTIEPLSVPIYEIQSSKNFILTKTTEILDGPRVFILEKE